MAEALAGTQAPPGRFRHAPALTELLAGPAQALKIEYQRLHIGRPRVERLPLERTGYASVDDVGQIRFVVAGRFPKLFAARVAGGAAPARSAELFAGEELAPFVERRKIRTPDPAAPDDCPADYHPCQSFHGHSPLCMILSQNGSRLCCRVNGEKV